MAALTLFSSLAGATVPNVLTYQGRLKQTGLPVTGNRQVNIFLCPQLAGPIGNCFPTGSQGVAISNGVFRTTFTVPSTVDWTTGDWYLEIQVDGAGFSPREKFTAVPYAVHATSATTLTPEPGQYGVLVSTHAEIGGHVRIAGLTPSAGSGCGVTASISGADGAGRITLGDPLGSLSCRIIFASEWTPNKPVCFFNNESQSQTLWVSSVDTGAVTFSSNVTLTAGDTISFICMNY